MSTELTSETRHEAIDARNDLIANILTPENWPTPNWYDTRKKSTDIRNYKDYLTFQLRDRYLAGENDFRCVLGNFPRVADVITAGRINDLLHSAREALEHTAPDLLMVSSALDLIDRYIVWLFPEHIAMAHITTILLRLSSLSPFQGKDTLVERLTDLSKKGTESYSGERRAVSDEAIHAINKQIRQDQIDRGLQINRLKSLRLWGVVFLGMFLIGSPLATNVTNVSGWPFEVIIGGPKLLTAWMNAFAMLLLGGVGGFLSGLLQVQSTRVSLSEYLENRLKLQLRPLVGGMVALILFCLLSWQVLPGIAIQSAGSYFLIAFLAGFSERYFLRLIDIKPENGNGRVSAQVETSKSTNPESPQPTLGNESNGKGENRD